MKTHVVLHGIQVGVRLYTVEANTSSQAAKKALDILIGECAVGRPGPNHAFVATESCLPQHHSWMYHVDGDFSCHASVFDPREWDKPAVEKWAAKVPHVLMDVFRRSQNKDWWPE
jgi:hypothetical protein